LARVAGKRKGALRNWLSRFCARKPARLFADAPANELAWIIWAALTTGEAFRTESAAAGATFPPPKPFTTSMNHLPIGAVTYDVRV
jgi:hypothetical protein